MSIRNVTFSFAAAAAAIALAACGGTEPAGAGDPGPDPDPTPPSVEYPADGDTVIVDVTSGGGFVPAQIAVDSRPEFRLYGDGTAIAIPAGETSFGGFPELETYRLTPEGVEALLAAARDAGLLEGAPQYGQPLVTDLPTTVVTISDGDSSFSHAVYALGFEDPAAGLSADEVDARGRLRAFIDDAVSLVSARPELVAEPQAAYSPEALEVYAWEFSGERPETAPIPWPLGPLGDLRNDVANGIRCGTVTGGDITAIREAAPAPGGFPIWQSKGKSLWTVGLNPVLPGEAGCGTGDDVEESTAVEGAAYSGFRLPPEQWAFLVGSVLPQGTLAQASEDDVARAEQVIAEHLEGTKDEREIAVRDARTTYVRQYVTLVQPPDGTLVYVNALCDVYDGEGIDTQVIMVLDGGSCFWQALVDVTNGTIEAFMVNGEA
jgi:hypothetical protein